MRKRAYVFGAAAATLIAAAAAAIFWLHPRLDIPFSKTSCENALPPNWPDTALAQAALRFVGDLVSDNADAAYAELDAASQAATRPAKLRRSIHDIVAPAGPLSDFQLTEMYRIDVAFGQQRNQAMCANSTNPDDQVAVAVTSAAKQAYVVVEGHGKTMDWAFVLWFVDEQGWRVQAVNISPSTLAGRSAEEVWRQARGERDRHHIFNATVLYSAANQLADRGSNFRLALQQRIRGEMAKLTVPRELQGPMPFTWHLIGPDSYKIVWIGATAFDAKIYLSIVQEIEPWPTDQEADRRNRQLIAEVASVFAEYSSAFAGVTVTARDAGGSHLFQTAAPPVAAAQ